MLVTVVSPSGTVEKSVRCRDRAQCLEVIETEAEDAPLWTMLLITKEERGRVRPVARWAIGPEGLVRTPYRGNAEESMDRLMNAARNAYAYGEMEPAEVRQYLMSEYGASPEDAYLAASAGRLLLEEP
jgi:hypothetical protein